MSIFLERQEVRKRKGQRSILKRVERISLSVMIVLAGLAAMYGLYVLVFMGPYFAVEDIVVRGHWRNLDAKALIEIADVQQGDNMFMLSVSAVHDRLMTNPWVREVAVRRFLPHTLLIAVEEYEPVAIVIEADGMYYVDAEGVRFKRIEADDDGDLPFITGMHAYVDRSEGASGAQRHFVSEALAILGAFEQTALGKRYGISELNYDLARGYVAVTEKGALEVLLGARQVQSRLMRLDRFARAILSRGRHIDYILADEPGRVIVKYNNYKYRSAEVSELQS